MVERAISAIGCDVNKPVRSSLHSERVKNLKITQNNKYWQTKNLRISSKTWFLIKKNP